MSIYSQPGARVCNIANNPKVALNFAGDGHGGDIIILGGTAEIIDDAPSAAENEAWIAKYAGDWERAGMTAELFAARFSIPVRIRISALRGR